MKKLKKLLVAILSVAMVLSAGCFTPGGLALTGLVLDATSVDTEYVVGDAYDFSGIRLEARYNNSAENKQVGYEDVEMTYDTEFNTKVGTHTITVKYTDEAIGQSQETTFDVSVVSAGGTTPAETMDVADFIKPAAITKYLTQANADRLEYGQAGYESQLSKKTPDYKVGDDNAFKFVTRLWVYDYDLQETVEEIDFAIDARIYQDDIELVAGEVGSDNKVQYTRPGETAVLVTVDVVRQEYQFADGLAGQKFTIKVTPDTDIYLMDTPIVQEITVNVVDGYNVYSAKELSLIDNTNVKNTTSEFGKTNASDWESIKAANGLTNLNPNAIILQNDLAITANDLPENMLGTLQEDFYYYEAVTVEGSTTYQPMANPVPAGTKYIRDYAYMYCRVVEENDTFSIEGNSFTIDFSQAPLVPSTEVAPKVLDSKGNAMKASISHSSVFYVDSGSSSNLDGGTVNINNIDFIGNAARSQIVDKIGGDLIGSGGTIILKTRNATVNIDNMNMRNIFTALITEERTALLNVNYVKAYDMFQNWLYLWGGDAVIKNSVVERVGGPITLVTHGHFGTNDYISSAEYVNCILKAELTGQEFWFSTVGANQLVGQIVLLSSLLSANGMGSYVNNAGKLNLVAVVMEDGSDTSVVGNYDILGKLTIKESDEDVAPFVLSRMYNDPTDAIAQYTRAIQTQLRLASPATIVPLYNCGEMFTFVSNPDTAELTMVTGNDQLPMIPFNPYTQFDQTTMEGYMASQYVGAVKGAYSISDYYALNYGGFGIVLGGYNA